MCRLIDAGAYDESDRMRVIERERERDSNKKTRANFTNNVILYNKHYQ